MKTFCKCGCETQLSSAEEILIIDGGSIPDGSRQAVDPSIPKIENQWWMFFSSQDTSTWNKSF
ncbi:hypothetical protein [Nitrosopumilus sp.]|uniref:hypothetical protein n=1 Tax=Nitrosopumilus sp. TaxID=2024843 RepID=UPI00292F1DBC|nr:hypothetical protein [Nitrosopumilus sp.]